MINLSTEQVLTLRDAANHLPRRRAGRQAAVATLYRWASRGLRGQRLETLQVGGTLCTSIEAMQRFFERLGQAKSSQVMRAALTRNNPVDYADVEDLDVDGR